MNSYEYKAWRTAVFLRDNHTCQKCGDFGVYIMAHHIKSWSDFPDLRYDANNGISLCRRCHSEEDPAFAKFQKKN